jgi:Flp pilus assembly protein TadG
MTFLGKRQYRRFRADQTGSELVEFALSISLLLMAVLGVIGCSLALYADHFVAYAAREATRYAMVRGSSWNGTPCSTPSTFSCTATSNNISDFVTSISPPGLTASNLTVTSGSTALSGGACTPTGSPGCIITVTVSYPFTFVLPLLPKDTFVLKSTAATTISQ